MRTCVGCRRRDSRAELLRVVLVAGEVVPDPDGRLPGRGAHVHRGSGCLDLAERRRAFHRALKAPGALDLSALRGYLATGALPIAPH
ncbi:MAG: YlxR family protein [Actinomycetes bacterium]